MAIVNKIMTTIVHGECLSVTAYKIKKYDFLNVWRPVVRKTLAPYKSPEKYLSTYCEYEKSPYSQ